MITHSGNLRWIPRGVEALFRSLASLAPILFGHASSAQQFGPAQLLTGQTYGARSVHSADLDGDGDQDVLSASGSDKKIAWYENREGRFGPQQVIWTTAVEPQSVLAADLDGDGDQDVLSASASFQSVPPSTEAKIAWYENTDGSGSFGPPQVISITAIHARSVAAADLDGDGDQDVLSASESGTKVAWYENVDSMGSFGPPQSMSGAAYGARSVSTADLDGDGDLDALTAGYSSVAWYENTDGLGGFSPAQALSIGSTGHWSAVAVDLDADGDPDVLSARYQSFSSNHIAWHENQDGLGTFGPEQIISTAAKGARSVFAADLDGDGDFDALSASSYDAKIAWYENTDGFGSFGAQGIISDMANGAASVVAADMDGDGDLDVLSASEGASTIASHENTDGLGTFAQEQLLSGGMDAPTSVVATDLDGDGDQDVIAASWYDDKIAWYENTDGLGGLGSQQIISTAAVAASDLFTADLDGDGDQDVLSASAGDDEIAWYENTDSLGGFGPEQLVSTTAESPRSVFAADLDGDRDLDVLSASLLDDEVAWYENMDGPAGFGPGQVISTAGDGATSVIAADLDGDGDQDVLAASAGDDEIVWYENTDGKGSFGPQQIVSTAANGPVSVFAADLDGDQDQDVLSASRQDHKIAWYENTDALGSFGPQQVISIVAIFASSVFAADLDEDGDADVLSSSEFDDKIAWYVNTDGLGTFGPQQVISTTANGAQSAFAVDLDGDGDQDVLSASFIDDKLAWYENKVCCSLKADSDTLSLSVGGKQVCTLDAGVQRAFDPYWILSTSAGASPGLALAPPPLKLPLGSSPLLRRSALAPNLLFVDSVGLLDSAGKATATLTLPAGSDPSLAGATLHHAYLVLAPLARAVTGVSNAVSLQLVP